MPKLTRDQVDTINLLIRAKHIDAARHLTTEWGDETALARLNAKHPQAAPVVSARPIPHEPDPPAPPPLTLYQQFRIPLLIFLALFVLAGVLMIMQQYQQQYEAAQRMFGR